MSEDSKQGRRLEFLGALAGGLAHEIRNPLSTISMNLQLLREDWAEPETDRERRALRKVDVLMREVKRLETILDDFLRFTGGHKLTKEPTYLNELVEEVLEFLRPRFLEGGIEVRRMLGDLPWLHLDRNAVKQVLMNLLLNAIDAMEGGGEIMVRTARDGTSAVLDLTDTGEGIPPELQEKVWHVYYSRRKSGTGMGLPTARRIVEEHDGSISLVSEVGKGTRFTLRFPLPTEIPG